jgi:hypothetical protein
VGSVIGILASEAKLWPEFCEAVGSRRFCIIDDVNLDVSSNFLYLPRALRLATRFREVPKRHQFVASRLLSVGVTMLLSTDRPVSLLNSVAISCPNVKQILVAHTTIQPLNKPRVSETLPFPNRVVLVWGLRDKEILGAVQPDLRVQVNGSIRNAAFLRQSKAGLSKSPINRICLISSHLGETKEESRKHKPHDIRYLLRERLLQLASAATSALGLPLHIALKPPTMGFFSEGSEQKYRAERDYFQRAFGGKLITYSDPSIRYSSYLASSESTFTLGLPTGALIEAIGRGSAALSLDTTGSAEFTALPGQYRIDELDEARIVQYFERIVRRSSHQRTHDMRDWIFDPESDGPLVRLEDLLST